MMFQPESAILAGALFNAGFAVFHLAFWRIFEWKQDLAKLSRVNQAIVPVLNLCLIFAFLVFAYVSWFRTHDLLNTRLGHSLLVLISIFWFLRAIEQIVYFGIRTVLSATFLVIFVLGALLYAYPLMAPAGSTVPQ